ncbi:MAG: CAP domain-containing protein [Halorhabdus sp.]
MPECAICGASDELTYTCTYCEQHVCPDHRLPEQHACPAASAQSGKPLESETQQAKRDGDTGSADDNSDRSAGPVAADRARAANDSKSKDVSGERDGLADRSRTVSNASEVRSDDSIGVFGLLVAPFVVGWVGVRRIIGAANRLAVPAAVAVVVLAALIPHTALTATLVLPSGPGEDVDRTLEQWSHDVNALATGGIPTTDLPDNVVNITRVRTSTPGGTAAKNNDESGGLFAPEQLNRNHIERVIHRRVNTIRQRRGLRPLDWDPKLAAIARSHSTDMASRGYFAHESPGGETFEDRYAQAGYDCKLYISNDRYVTGAENIAYTYAYQDVQTGYRGVVSYDGNETAIAFGIVRQWMHSPPHREIMLEPYWRHEGIGVAIADTAQGTRVYATQNFC